MPFFVYLLECSDKTLYCGYTTNIEKRLEQHNKGLASKYTRSRNPVKLVFVERKESRAVALKREAEIKGMSRKQKQEMVGNYRSAGKN